MPPNKKYPAGRLRLLLPDDKTKIWLSQPWLRDLIVTKDDIVNRRYFHDTVCRGRDYYTPYRALLPKGVDQLIVAGRHYSAEPEAQKRSREIPPCMARYLREMLQAMGMASKMSMKRS